MTMTNDEMFEKQFQRPRNYFQLSGRARWAIDKNLGLLDWSGESAALTESQLARMAAHYHIVAGPNAMCERKTDDIMQRDGYKKTGYVLLKDGPTREVCVSDGGAVSWFTHEQWWWLMHNRDHVEFEWPKPIAAAKAAPAYPREVTVFDHFDVPMDPTSDDGKETIALMDAYIRDGTLPENHVNYLRGELDKANWLVKAKTDWMERAHRFFLEGMKAIGLGDGTKGWIEHADGDGPLRKDDCSLEGEIHFGFEQINACIDELRADRDHWRANHADQVRRCALLRQREDLPVDRVPAYRELVRMQRLYAVRKERDRELRTKLMQADLGACTCVTKTPDPTYHAEDCRHRLIMEALTLLERI